MSNRNTYHINSRFFKIFSLGMLLLLSPCSVRTSLQSVLNLEQTEVTSKSKIAQLNSSCKVSEAAKIKVSDLGKNLSKSPVFVPFQSNYIVLNQISVSQSLDPFQVEKESVNRSKVPFYILYKNKKDFIITALTSV